MPKPSDLHAARERKAVEEHDAVYGDARDDVGRLFDHFAQKVGDYGITAAILTHATIIAVPEGEPYA
ncbi:hypothetical protein [Corynebacterium lujinxingii]|uniref:Uncharacterized protein n=1 Tax=Corynebacterium lujinxingii TaxID=2763010 RepID=A0A7H0K0P7_9CORY|nr:hypothetical protein [Corynebacterium lujinxingii]MBC3179393.1 hypothetical protein [Corynebacterium lujinxingii]NNO11500.1 hypothetical protein [Corynebacterium lujinxingii]QNP90863.1 hypothetical protein IAU68_03610 [Corynebacterium lujinxingii]